MRLINKLLNSKLFFSTGRKFTSNQTETLKTVCDGKISPINPSQYKAV